MLLKVRKSTMVGTICKVLVQEGQPMSVGEQIVILEYMKMEIPIEAEASGIVKKVFVAEDDFVNVDDALVEVE